MTMHFIEARIKKETDIIGEICRLSDPMPAVGKYRKITIGKFVERLIDESRRANPPKRSCASHVNNLRKVGGSGTISKTVYFADKAMEAYNRRARCRMPTAEEKRTYARRRSTTRHELWTQKLVPDLVRHVFAFLDWKTICLMRNASQEVWRMASRSDTGSCVLQRLLTTKLYCYTHAQEGGSALSGREHTILMRELDWPLHSEFEHSVLFLFAYAESCENILRDVETLHEMHARGEIRSLMECYDDMRSAEDMCSRFRRFMSNLCRSHTDRRPLLTTSYKRATPELLDRADNLTTWVAQAERKLDSARTAFKAELDACDSCMSGKATFHHFREALWRAHLP